MMEEIFDILKNNFSITHLTINGFTSADEELSIVIEILTEQHKIRKIIFNTVSNININSEYYMCSFNSSIEIEDIVNYQYQDVIYKISIMEDVMVFYCKSCRIE